MRSLQFAQAVGQERGERVISGKHLLVALAGEEGSLLSTVLAARGVSAGVLRTVLNDLDGLPSRRPLTTIEAAPELKALIQWAGDRALEDGRTAIERRDLELAVVSVDSEDPAATLMKAAGLRPSDLLRDVVAASESDRDPS